MPDDESIKNALKNFLRQMLISKLFVELNKNLNQSKVKLKFFLPHHPVVNHHTTAEVKRVCSAVLNYQDLALKANISSGPEVF